VGIDVRPALESLECLAPEAVVGIRGEDELDGLGLTPASLDSQKGARPPNDQSRERQPGAREHRTYLGEKPTVSDAETLRPDMSVRMSPGAARFDLIDAGVTAVIAWLSVRLLTANRIRVFDSFDEPPSW
jgi:hypothetical protein